MRRIGALGLSTMLFLLGCAEKAAPTKEGPKTTVATTASAKVKTAAEIKADKQKAEEEHEKAEREGHKKLAHCPSFTDGSTETVADVDGGVELTVTAKAEPAVKEIRAYAKFLQEQTVPGKHPATEDEEHAEGARIFGRCPVVGTSTTITWAEAPGGAKITVKPRDPSDVEWVRRETRERMEELTDKAAAEKRWMAHCPSAADKANTFIMDTAGSIAISIVSRDAAIQKDIRERTKYVMDSLAKDPKTSSRTGQLKPGEGMGRCPLLFNQAVVTSEEIPLGSKITIKPEEGEDLIPMVRELKDRGERFVP